MSDKEENLGHVKCIEILMPVFMSHLMDIDPQNHRQRKALDNAVEFIASYERQQLFNLRKAFE